MGFVLQSFKNDVLASDITDSATSMTLTTGAFGTPTGEQMLVVDYDIAAKREIMKVTIDGTAVTGITRAQDGTAAVAHSSGAKIIMAFVPSHYTGLTDGTAWGDNVLTSRHLDANLLAGWTLLSTTGTRVSNTSMTISGDVTAQIGVGDKLKLTDTTLKYFYVTAATYSAPNTTVTFTGGTDYALVGNPSNIYFSHGNPVGFPANSATFSPIGVNYAAKTAAQNTITTQVDISGLSIATMIPTGKRIRVSLVTMFNGTNAGNQVQVKIVEDSTTVTQAFLILSTAGVNGTLVSSVILTPSAGAHTYKATATLSSGTGSVSLGAGADYPSYIMAEIV